MREIKSIDEIHIILLGIAKVFADICERHEIPYYMLGGTMLGAIRHKGFIPWDDDMDFAIPRPYYQQAIDFLEKELPPPYRCCTYKNNLAVRYCFFKIDDFSTLIVDNRLPLPIEQHLGLNIDVFPLDSIDIDDANVKKIMIYRKLNRLLFVNNPKSKAKQLVRSIIRRIIPISRDYVLSKQETLLVNCKSSRTLANAFGRWKEREYIPIEWYGEGAYFQFETLRFRGIKEYDSYLTKLYGNYMLLPPENQRLTHVNQIYYRD